MNQNGACRPAGKAANQHHHQHQTTSPSEPNQTERKHKKIRRENYVLNVTDETNLLPCADPWRYLDWTICCYYLGTGTEATTHPSGDTASRRRPGRGASRRTWLPLRSGPGDGAGRQVGIQGRQVGNPGHICTGLVYNQFEARLWCCDAAYALPGGCNKSIFWYPQRLVSVLL